MSHNERTRKLLEKHFEEYPQSEIQDIFKFLHQSSFGCEHMVTNDRTAAHHIQKEWDSVEEKGDRRVEPLDGAYSRVHLEYISEGLSAKTFGRLFYLSAKDEKDGLSRLEEKLDLTEELIKNRLFPFSLNEFALAREQWKENGYSAVHHSDAFRNAYKPSYRVIANEFVPFLPLLAKLDQMLKKGSVRLAVEGSSASGKTTLGRLLEKLYDCTVFHVDDFFLRPEQRTRERLEETGGNFDRERFLEEVLIPLSRNEAVNYHRFDCSTGTLLPSVSVTPKKLTVIEGAYSMHTELEKYYDLSVFLDIDSNIQRERILKRNTPQMAERFFSEWIPLEKRYFDGMNTKSRCDLTVRICE